MPPLDRPSRAYNMVAHKITMVRKTAWKILHNLAQIKRELILLLTMALLFSAILYIFHFSFKPSMPPENMFDAVVNQMRSYYITACGHSGNGNQNTAKQTTATAAPTVTKHISLHYHVAHPLNYHFILDEPDKCSQWDPFLVLMVPVAPHQLEARNAIRSTWGNEITVKGKAVMTLFLVGLTGGSDSEKAQQQLEEESRQHRDLVQSNFVDSYFNLTIKTMVIMDWLATRCPQATYVMKIDTDMYLNLGNLMTLLLAPNTPRDNYITGVVMRDRSVIRNKNSKWYVSEELYPEPKYPTYLLITGYVFSNDLPEKIVEISKVIKAFNIEDAYVGACLKHLGIAPSSPPDPSQFRMHKGQYNRKVFLRIISTVVGSPQQIMDVWKDVKSSR